MAILGADSWPYRQGETCVFGEGGRGNDAGRPGKAGSGKGRQGIGEESGDS